jgi:GTP-binding protein
LFIDSARIFIRAGNGGDGHVSFHREKYVTNGGPDGGDGGRGGSVVFFSDASVSTLQDLRYKRKLEGQHGEKGGTRQKSGRGGEDLRIRVPVGTLLIDDETGRTLADLTRHGQEAVICKGGTGGKGNMHFANSVRQAPQFARAGIPGEERWIRIELKLIADVGLVGFPNVGKSTLLSVVSAARPKIADYPFTTLEPNLGVVSVGDASFVLADIPGLIEGAHDGLGLGHEFLKHVERTRLLIHVVDVSGSEGRDPLVDFDRINEELQLFNSMLATRPQLVAANKIDQADPEAVERFVSAVEARGYTVYPISAVLRDGVDALMRRVAADLAVLPATILISPPSTSTDYVFEEEIPFEITRAADGAYEVGGAWVQNLVASTNFDDHDSLQYFQRIIRKKGLVERLLTAGIKEGQLVRMEGLEFEFVP